MAKVVVLATGGTIASAATAGGGAVAERDADQLLAAASPAGVELEARDVLNLNSFLIGHRELRLIAQAVTTELARDDVGGVVITHGTDTMEETAFLLDLVHGGEKPIALTGAQKAADRPDTDGPQNLRDAIAVAASPEARGCGALIVFGGLLYPAHSTRKHHTVAAEPFRAADGGPVGRVHAEARWVGRVEAPGGPVGRVEAPGGPAGVVGAGSVRVHARPVRRPPLRLPDHHFDTTRVDVVSVYPGADAALARAAARSGAAGVVLAGTGAGNGNHAILEWVREAVAADIAVGLSTRVPEGPVAPLYGNGGGVDLIAAGALNMRNLPLFHARLLLAALLATGEPVTQELIDRYL